MEKEEITQVLDNLLENEQILGCMIANRDLTYIMPTSEKQDVGANKMMDDIISKGKNIFKMIDWYSKLKLKHMKWSFKNCEAWFYIFPDFQSTLVAIVPNSTDEELLEPKIDKACQILLKVKDKKSMQST